MKSIASKEKVRKAVIWISGGVLFIFLFFPAVKLISDYKEKKTLDYELQKLVEKDPFYIDETKILGASTDNKLYSILKTKESEYVLIQIVKATLISGDFDGDLTVRLPNGDLYTTNSSGFLPEIILRDGSVTDAQVVRGAITSIDLTQGGVIPIEILNAAILEGRLNGVFSARTTDTGFQLAAKISQNSISEGYVVTNPTFVSDRIRTFGFLVMYEERKTNDFVDDVLAADTINQELDSETALAKIANDAAVLNDPKKVLTYQGRVIRPNYDTGTYTVVGVEEAPEVSLNLFQDLIKEGLASVEFPTGTSSEVVFTGAVTTNEILDLTIQAIDLADNSVLSRHIKNDSIVSEDIAGNSINSSKVADDSLTTADLSNILTFGDGDFLDLGAVAHDDSALQGLRLPNVATASPTSPSSGEGFLAYDTAGNQVLVYNGSSWAEIGGNVTLTTSGETSTISSNSGLELTGDLLSIIKGCADGELLKWNDTTDVWYCTTDVGAGGSGISTVEENNVSVVTSATSIDFLGADFIVTAAGGGEADIAIDYANSAITRNNQTESISGAWTFSNLTISDTNVPLTGASLTLDFNNASDRTLTIANSAAGTANLSVDGTITGSNLSGTNTGDQNLFATINAPNGTDPVADATSDTLNFADGTGITITGDSGSDTLTIASTLGTSIETGEITDGTITGDDINSNIAGSGLTLTAASPDTLDVNTGNGIQIASDAVALGPLTADWNQTGAFDISLNNASSELRILESTGATYYGTFDVGDLVAADATYTFSGTSGTVLTSTNYSGTLDSVYVNVGESPAAGDIAGSFSGGLTINSNTIDDAELVDALTYTGTLTLSSTLTANGTLDANGVVTLGDGGDAITVDGSSLALQTTGAGSDITINAVDQVILTDFTTCTALETVSGVLTCGTDDVGGAGVWTANGNVLHPTSTDDQVSIGGLTTTDFFLGVSGARTGKALVGLNETGDQNILTASASGTTVANLDRSGNLAIEGQFSDLSTATLTINDALSVLGAVTVTGVISDSDSNLILDDTVDIGSATTGINVTTGGAISDIDGTLQLNDTVDITGTLSDSNSNLVLDDTVDIGSATTGINITTAGLISDTDGNVVIGDAVDLGSATTGVNVTTTGVLSDSDGDLILNDQLNLGSSTTGLLVTTDGVISDIDDSSVVFTEALNIGGLTGVSYNAISDSGTAGNASTDDDLYIEDILEVDGTFYLGADGITDITGNGLEVSGTTLAVRLDTTAADGATATSVSGLEFVGGELSLIRGCSPGGILEWDNTAFEWDCGTDDVGGAGVWTANGNVLHPTSTDDQVSIGGLTTTDFFLGVSGARVGKALVGLNETGDQNILTASASGTTIANLDRSGNLAIEGQLSDLSTATLTINDALSILGALTVTGVISDSDSNLVLDDTVDIGSATTGVNVTTAGVISDIDGNLVLGDTVDIGSATTGVRVGTTGTILDIDGDLILDDQLNLGSSTTGLLVTTDGVISDIDDASVAFAEAISVTGNITLTGQLSDSDSDVQVNDNLDPVSDATFSLGDTTTSWLDLFLTGQICFDDTDCQSSWGAVGPWTYASPFIYPDNATDFVGMGTVTTSEMHGLLSVRGTRTGKALVVLDDRGTDQNILTASASGTTVANLNRSGDLAIEGQLSDLSTATLTLNDALSVLGAVTVTGVVSDSDSNLVLDDTTDIGSATTGINITIAGLISDADGNVVIGDTVDLGSATTGVNVTTAGLLSDSDGNLVLGDTVDIGSSTTGVNITTAGVISDIDGNLVLSDTLDLGSSTTGLNLTTAGQLTDIDATAISIDDDLSFVGAQAILTTSAGNLTFTPDTTGNVVVSADTDTVFSLDSTVTNADTFNFSPNNSGVATFVGTLTTADLTGNQTWTLPDATGNVCLSTGNCAGTTNYWQLNSNVIAPGNAAFVTDRVAIGGLTTTDFYLGVSGARVGKALVGLNETGDQNILTASASGTTQLNLTRTGTLEVGDLTLGLDDTSATISTFDTNEDLTIDPNGTGAIILTATTGLNITSGGLISDLDGNLVLDDQTDIGSTTTGLRVTTAGQLTDIDGTAVSIDDDISFVDAQSIITTTGDLTLDPADEVVLGDADTIIIGGHAGNVAYNVISDSGGTPTGANINSDDDLFIEGALEVDSTLYADGGIDTTFTAGSVVFAGTSGVLTEDNTNFFWDDTTNKLGIGLTPVGKLDVSGAVTGKALTILNETGDQDILVASKSGTTVMRLGRNGDLSLTDSGSSNIDFNLSSTGDFTISDAGTPFVTFSDIGGITFDPTTSADVTFTTDNAAGSFISITGLASGSGSSLCVDGSNNVVTCAAGSGSDVWTLSGSVIYPDLISYNVLVGSVTAGDAIGNFTVTGTETGKALAVFNDTGTDQNILVASASGANVMYLSRGGNLTVDVANAIIRAGTQAVSRGEAALEENSEYGRLVLKSSFNAGSRQAFFRATSNDISLSLGTTTLEGGDLVQYRDDAGGQQFYLDADAAGSAVALTLFGGIDINGTGTNDIAGTLNLSGNNLTSTADLIINAGGGDVASDDRWTIGSQTPGVAKLTVTGAEVGKALVGLNETGDQNILTASASGTTQFNLTRTGTVEAGDLTLGLDDTSATITTFDTEDITIDPLGGNILSSDALNIGGATEQAYNFFATSTAGSVIADGVTDLYIQDEFEVDGATRFQGDITVLQAGSDNLILSDGAYDPVANVDYVDITVTADATAVESFYGLGLDFINMNNGSVQTMGGIFVSVENDATTSDDTVRGIVLENNSGSAADLDAGLYINNADTAQAITDAILIQSTGGGAITTGLDFDDTDIVTDIELQNGETIDNNTDSVFTFATNTANADRLTLTPNVTGSATTFTGTITSSDLTADRTWTFPNDTGNVCLSTGNCAGTTNYWQLNTNVLAPGNAAAVTDRVAIGGLTTTDFFLGVSGARVGKALVGLNETGDQNILVASSSGNQVLQLSRIPAAGTSGDIFTLSPTLNAMNGSDTVNTVFINIGNPTHTGSNNILNGIALNSISGSGATTNAIFIDQSWNRDIAFNDPTAVLALTSSDGQLDITDGSNSFVTIDDIGTSANVYISGDITLTVPTPQTTAITITDTNYTNAISLGDNAITGTTYTIASTVGDLTINSADEVVFGDTDTFIIGGHAGNVAYNVLSDSGGTPIGANINSDDDLFIEGALEVDSTLYADGGIDTTFTAGSVVFAGTSGVLAEDNTNFFWDDTANKLGIGLTPVGKLDVSGAVTGKALVILNETGDQAIFVASESGTTRFIIADGGNVGVGSTNPGANLEVRGSKSSTSQFAADNEILQITNSNQTLNNWATIYFDDSSDFPSAAIQAQFVDHANEYAELHFSTRNAATGLASRIVITSAGNVGIGDVGPDAQLEVLATTEQLRLTHTDGTTDSRFTVSSTGDLTIDNLGSGTADQVVLGDTDTLNIGGSGSTDVAYNVIGDSTVGASANMNSDDDLFIEGALEVEGNTSPFVVDNAGNVGIGLSSPVGKLDVSGAVTGKALTILNETGDQDIFTASSAGTTRFRISNAGHLLPGADDTYDLGSNTLRFRDLYLGPATLHIGTSTADEGQLTYDTTANSITLLNVVGDINLQADNDTSDFIYLDTAATADSATFFWEGYTANDPGVRVNASTNEVEYRDENESSWTTLDSFAAGAGVWTANGNVLHPTSTDDQVSIGGLTTTDFFLGVSGARTGKALVGLNETGDQNILTASASGTTQYNLTRTGTVEVGDLTLGLDDTDATITTNDTNENLRISANGTGSITIDPAGAGSIVLGSADVTSITFTTDNDADADFSFVGGATFNDNVIFTFTDSGDFFRINTTIGSGGDTVDINPTIASDATSYDALSIDFTLNASAGAATIYPLNITNLDNAAETAIVDALALFSNNQATETLADGVIIRHNAASGTLTDALQIENTTAGGTISNAINILETAGTITTGVNIGAGVGTAIVLQQGESIDNTTDNQINLNIGASGTLLLTSSTTASLTNSAGALAINAFATGLNLQADGTIDVNLAGGSGATGCTVANSTGNLTCSGSITTTATSGTQGWWQRNGTVLAPTTVTDQLAIGGLTTSDFYLGVSGARVGKALVGLNETGDQDIFVASKSGTRRFSIANNGSVRISPSLAGVVFRIDDTSGNEHFTFDNSNATLCVGLFCTNDGIVKAGFNLNLIAPTNNAAVKIDAGDTLPAALEDDNDIEFRAEDDTIVNLTAAGQFRIDAATNVDSTVASAGTVNIAIDAAPAAAANYGVRLDYQTIDDADAGETFNAIRVDLTGTSIDNDIVYALSLNNANDATGAATDALITLENNDANTAVTDGIVFLVGGANAPDFTNGINFDAADLTTEIVLENAETITNQVNGAIAFTGVGQTNNAALTIDFETNAAFPTLSSSTDTAIGIAEDFLPQTDDTHDLGSNTLRFRDLYLGPATLHVGTSTADEAQLTYDTTANSVTLLNIVGDINLQADNDIDDFIYLDTAATANSATFFWEGYTANDPGVRVDPATNKLQFRDENESAWTAIDSTTNLWQRNSTVLAPATVTDQLTIGGGTTTDFYLGVSGARTGKALVGLNETGDQAILTASASGTPLFIIQRDGDVGVDTVDPINTLQIGSDQNSGRAANHIARVVSGNNGNASLKLVETDASNEWGLQIRHTGGSDRIDFLTGSGALASADTDFTGVALTIDRSSLNVGLGDISPDNILDVNSTATSGNILTVGADTAVVLAGTLTGENIDLNANYTSTNQSATGVNILLDTASNTSGTVNYKGLNVSGGILNQSTAGTTTFTGLDVSTPGITQTAGTLSANGLRVTTGNITTNGTQNGIVLDLSASDITTAGTVNGLSITGRSSETVGTITGINIGGITAGAATENAISIGSGWDTILFGTTAGTSIFDFTSFDVTSAGAVTTGGGLIIAGAASGITTLSLSGDITWTATTPSITINDGEIMTIVDAASPDTFTINTTGSFFSFSDATNSFTFDVDTGPVYAGTARPAVKVTLVPEFEGATLTGDGTSNVGTMTSDFCSGTARRSINTAICTVTTEEHNYYSWTANATNDYDVWTRWQVPSDFGALIATNPIVFNGWRTSASAGTSVTLTIYNPAGTVCGTATSISGTVATWNSTNYTNSGCTPTAGSFLLLRTTLSVGVNSEFARIGEIEINYLAQF